MSRIVDEAPKHNFFMISSKTSQKQRFYWSVLQDSNGMGFLGTGSNLLILRFISWVHIIEKCLLISELMVLESGTKSRKPETLQD